MQLSIVDISPVPLDGDQAQGLRDSLELCRRADALGYRRYWLAEHHGASGIASHAPEVLIPVFAGATRRIRVGSGAVLLNHYSPFKVAEQFRTLHALFPDRIDLGIGRAFAGPVAEAALRRVRETPAPDDYPQQLVELRAWLGQDMPADHPFAQAPILPDVAGAPELWLLGSSQQSPHWAAQLGLGYVFAGFISPQGAPAALANYRRGFRPSRAAVGIAEPYAVLAMHVVCAETDAAAERLAMTVRAMYAQLARGRFGRRLPGIEEGIAEFGGIPPAETDPWPRFVVGDPDRVKAQLLRMAEATGAREIMIQDMILDPQARQHSYELLARAFELDGSGTAAAA